MRYIKPSPKSPNILHSKSMKPSTVVTLTTSIALGITVNLAVAFLLQPVPSDVPDVTDPPEDDFCSEENQICTNGTKKCCIGFKCVPADELMEVLKRNDRLTRDANEKVTFDLKAFQKELKQLRDVDDEDDLDEPEKVKPADVNPEGDDYLEDESVAELLGGCVKEENKK